MPTGTKIIVICVFVFIFLMYFSVPAFGVVILYGTAQRQAEGVCRSSWKKVLDLFLSGNAQKTFDSVCASFPDNSVTGNSTTGDGYGQECKKISTGKNWQCTIDAPNKAERNGNDVTYYFPNGQYIFSGGSRAWRNNNPGNIRKSGKAIGSDAEGGGPFAIFPDYNTGYQEIINLLTGNKYKEKSIKDAIYKYAPPSENDSGKYADTIKKNTGLDINKKIEDLSAEELKKVADAIVGVEGYKPGKIISDDCTSSPDEQDTVESVEVCTNKKNHPVFAHSGNRIDYAGKIPIIAGSNAEVVFDKTFGDALYEAIQDAKNQKIIIEIVSGSGSSGHTPGSNHYIGIAADVNAWEDLGNGKKGILICTQKSSELCPNLKGTVLYNGCDDRVRLIMYQHSLFGDLCKKFKDKSGKNYDCGDCNHFSLTGG